MRICRPVRRGCEPPDNHCVHLSATVATVRSPCRGTSPTDSAPAQRRTATTATDRQTGGSSSANTSRRSTRLCVSVMSHAMGLVWRPTSRPRSTMRYARSSRGGWHARRCARRSTRQPTAIQIFSWRPFAQPKLADRRGTLAMNWFPRYAETVYSSRHRRCPQTSPKPIYLRAQVRSPVIPRRQAADIQVWSNRWTEELDIVLSETKVHLRSFEFACG